MTSLTFDKLTFNQALRLAMKADLSDAKAEILKWLFSAPAVQGAMMVALIKLIHSVRGAMAALARRRQAQRASQGQCVLNRLRAGREVGGQGGGKQFSIDSGASLGSCFGP